MTKKAIKMRRQAEMEKKANKLKYIHYYHIYGDNGHPIATVALGKVGRVWCRSIAICNPVDQFSYSDGRTHAAGLLRASAINGKNTRPFGPRNLEHKNAIKTQNYRYHDIALEFGDDFISHHSQYNVKLTTYEEKIVADPVKESMKLNSVKAKK